MLVTDEAQAGTIGGGALEHAGIEHARRLLAGHRVEPHLESVPFNLSRALSQCCGGVVTLQFERVPEPAFRVELFGAGHVAAEVVRILLRLPCRVTVHDPRPEWLARMDAVARAVAPQPSLDGSAERSIDIDLGATALRDTAPGLYASSPLGDNVDARVASRPDASCWLVMSHSHELDMEIVEAVLSRGDATFCGLIASRSKAAAFRSRLARKGFDTEEIAALTAPLGSRVRTGNTPMEVAVAAVSDLLTAVSSRPATEVHAAGGRSTV